LKSFFIFDFNFTTKTLRREEFLPRRPYFAETASDFAKAALDRSGLRRTGRRAKHQTKKNPRINPGAKYFEEYKFDLSFCDRTYAGDIFDGVGEAGVTEAPES
jgi:hypothetical protein